MATYDYSQFYKQGNDIYRANGQHLTYEEALPMFQSGFNAAFIKEKATTPTGNSKAVTDFYTPQPVQQPAIVQQQPSSFIPKTQQQIDDSTNDYIKQQMDNWYSTLPNGAMGTDGGGEWTIYNGKKIYNTTPQPTPQPQPQQSTLSESGQYYKSGNDVYEAGTNRHIELDEFQRLGLNFALLPQGQAPAPVQPPPALITPQLPDTGDPLLNQLLSTVQSQLDTLTSKGQTINPNIEITPEKAAEFLTQAQKEISPYYAGQMKIAREGLLREAGYTSDEIAQNEAKIEKQYGQNLRQLSSNMADTGFALSGQRQEGERTLAEDTQSGIDQARKTAEYNAGNSARQFAADWGGSIVPSFSYGASPKVQAGSEKFSRSLDMKPFYSISDSVLSGLTGSQQYNEQAQTKSRVSELEGLYRTQEANKQRLLNL